MRYGDMRGEAGRENDRLEPWLKSCPRLDGAALDDRRARGGGAETECCGGNGRDNEGCPVAGGTERALFTGEMYDYPTISPDGSKALWSVYLDTGFSAGWYTYEYTGPPGPPPAPETT